MTIEDNNGAVANELRLSKRREGGSLRIGKKSMTWYSACVDYYLSNRLRFGVEVEVKNLPWHFKMLILCPEIK